MKMCASFKYSLINWLFWYLHINNNHRNYVNVVLSLAVWHKAWRNRTRATTKGLLNALIIQMEKYVSRGIDSFKRYVHMCALRNLSYVDRIQPHLNNRNWSNFNAHTNCTIVRRQWFIINAFIYEWFLYLTKLWKDELLTFVYATVYYFVYGRIQ